MTDDPKNVGGTVRVANFLVESFGPLVAFYVFEHLYGLVAAIISGIVSGAILVATQIARDRKVSPFTAFVAASVVLFGAFDLKYQTGFFVKIEPALGNALSGFFFIATVIFDRPLINEMVEKRLGRTLHPRLAPFFRNMTIACAHFFFARAVIFIWMAYTLTLDQVLLVRGTLMPLTFVPLMAGTLVARNVVFGKKLYRQLLHGEETVTPSGD